MAFEVVLTTGFKKELKHIAKKHRQILTVITALIEELSKTPEIGAHLGKNIYKIQLAITGTTKGKSGGARVVTYVKIIAQTVILTEIYLKSEYDTVDVDDVIERLNSEGYLTSGNTLNCVNFVTLSNNEGSSGRYPANSSFCHRER